MELLNKYTYYIAQCLFCKRIKIYLNNKTRMYFSSEEYNFLFKVSGVRWRLELVEEVSMMGVSDKYF